MCNLGGSIVVQQQVVVPTWTPIDSLQLSSLEDHFRCQENDSSDNEAYFSLILLHIYFSNSKVNFLISVQSKKGNNFCFCTLRDHNLFWGITGLMKTKLRSIENKGTIPSNFTFAFHILTKSWDGFARKKCEILLFHPCRDWFVKILSLTQKPNLKLKKLVKPPIKWLFRISVALLPPELKHFSRGRKRNQTRSP